jgi:PKD repeat protein
VDFGDNTTVVNLGAVPGSATTQHVYASARTYTVSATATASNGGSATASTQVVVAAPPSPSISITAGANPVTGRAVTFSIVTAPAPGSGTTIQSVVVDFGDMTPVVNLGAVAGSATTQHVYALAGTFTVSATATDTGGGSATARTTVVVVSSATLSLSASANPVAGTAMQFTVGVAPGPGVAIQNVRLTYGDGTQDDLGVVSGTPMVKSHTYATGGTFPVTLIVTIAGGTAPLTTMTNVGVCGLLSNPVTITSRVVNTLQAWPGGDSRFTSATCSATLRAPTGTISNVIGDAWSITGVVGYSNCTVAAQPPTCGSPAAIPSLVNGRPVCSSAAGGAVSRATATLNCR